MRGSRSGKLQYVLQQLQGSRVHEVSGGGKTRQARRQTAGRDVEATQSEWTRTHNIHRVKAVRFC